MLFHQDVDNLSFPSIQIRLNLSKAVKNRNDFLRQKYIKKYSLIIDRKPYKNCHKNRCDNQPPMEIACNIVRNKETNYSPTRLSDKAKY